MKKLNSQTSSQDIESVKEKWENLMLNYGPTSSDLMSAIFPTISRVFAKTIAPNLVSVAPMDGYNEKISSDLKSINRDRKIESIVDNKEYVEMKYKDHPDYKSGRPSSSIFYIDLQRKHRSL